MQQAMSRLRPGGWSRSSWAIPWPSCSRRASSACPRAMRWRPPSCSTSTTPAGRTCSAVFRGSSGMSTAVRSIAASLRTLLAGALDYAGLYPPASLTMVQSVANYAHYLHHPHSWLLGRFVLPASRLDEFLAARERVAPVDEAKVDGGPVDAIEHPW